MKANFRMVKGLKPYLGWVLLGGTIFFLAKALKDNWQEVLGIELGKSGWGYMAIALLVTLLAHIWSGWVWSWILRFLDQPVDSMWCVGVYLKTNIAKYLPGNVWHFYGRVRTATAAGVPLTVGTLSLLMELLLMAAAALSIAAIGSPLLNQGLTRVSMVAMILMAVHPWVLNPLLKQLALFKGSDQTFRVNCYPLLPLLGELGFLELRGMGFLLTMHAFGPLSPLQIPQLMSAFSLSWLLGLVLPGAPGGIGVFEATAIAQLSGEYSPAIVLSAVALYRLVSILAEACGALLAWLHQPGPLVSESAHHVAHLPGSDMGGRLWTRSERPD
ncbi:MAG: UPF0104 family protein [Hormoscilla sp. SP12CHS1]|nr:UPF0104 family protein [Hormoscilla sp. SP12CHS1]